MKCSLDISYFLEEISSLSHSIVFLYFFALIAEEGFLSLLAILLISAFKCVHLSFSPLLFASLLFTALCKPSSDSHFTARVIINILGISKLKWTGMGEFNSDDHYTYYCGQESLRRNGIAIMVNKRVQNAVLGCNLKNNRMISVHFQGKPFNITVIQVYAQTSNAEEAQWFYEEL